MCAGNCLQVSPATAVLQARIASQAVCVGKFTWLIGGWDPGMQKDGGEILSDVWRLDMKSKTWSQPQVEVRAFPAALFAISGGPVTVCQVCPSCTHIQASDIRHTTHIP